MLRILLTPAFPQWRTWTRQAQSFGDSRWPQTVILTYCFLLSALTSLWVTLNHGVVSKPTLSTPREPAMSDYWEIAQYIPGRQRLSPGRQEISQDAPMNGSKPIQQAWETWF